MTDYYHILGVPPDADADALRAAYRRQAGVRHPDRGGSHERMLELNEAWEVLSDPASRRRYDRCRHGGMAGAADFQPERERARARAADYPKTWAAMEAFFQTLAGDFRDASYGHARAGAFAVPVIGNSVSGWVFIAAAAAAGWYFAGRHGWDYAVQNRTFGMWRALFGFGPSLAAAWVATWVHQAIGNEIKKASAGTARRASRKAGSDAAPSGAASRPGAGADKVVAPCPQCQQKLRVPRLPSALAVTCRACGHKFDFTAP